MLDCDQVFEILTRAPFPAGEPTDAAVELHLVACHECRQLAEALRPAVELFHESVGPEEGQALPGYRGRLRAGAGRAPVTDGPHRAAPLDLAAPADTPAQPGAGWRNLAAAAVVAAAMLGAHLWFGPSSLSHRHAPLGAGSGDSADATWTDSVWAGYELPRACRTVSLPLLREAAGHARIGPPASERGGRISASGSFVDAPAEPGEQQFAAALQCCTHCHRADQGLGLGHESFTLVAASCSHCHRWQN